jgi:hypothetical protein
MIGGSTAGERELAAVVGLVQARHVHGGLERGETVLLIGVAHGFRRTVVGIGVVRRRTMQE